MAGYVYLITHRDSGRGYVGQTTNANPLRRWQGHVCDASNRSHCTIDRAIAKHGPAAFSFEIIGQADTQELLNNLETLWIIVLGTLQRGVGFNVRHGGSRGRHSEETKEKLRVARSMQIITPEMYAQGGLKRRGHVVSVETRMKLSAIHKGKTFSDVTRQKMSAAAKIRSQTPEFKERWKANRSVGHTKGCYLSAEHKAAISATKQARKKATLGE